MQPKTQGLVLASALSIGAIVTGLVVIDNKDAVPIQPPASNTYARSAGFIFDAGPIKYPTQMYQYMSVRPGFTNKIVQFILKQRPNGEQWLNFLTFSVPLGARKILIEGIHSEPYLSWIPILEYDYDDNDPRDISVDLNWIPTNRPIFRILYAK